MWHEIVGGVWRLEYTTRMQIEVTSYALRLRDGSVAVLSPPPDATEELFAATEALGPVSALIANNSGHDLGQKPWQARFPAAVTYAPAGATAAIQKAKPGLRPVRPLADLAPLLPDTVRLLDIAGTRSGCTAFVADADGQRVVFVDEALSNVDHHHGPLPFRLIFRLTGTGPGLTRNKLWWFVFVKDRKTVAAELLAACDGATTLLPAHGAPITDVAAARDLLTAMA